MKHTKSLSLTYNPIYFITLAILALVASVMIGAFATNGVVHADTGTKPNPNCKTGTYLSASDNLCYTSCPTGTILSVSTSTCVNSSGGGCATPGDFDNSVCCPAGHTKTAMDCAFAKYINPVVNLMSAAIGLVVVISLMVAGIQYSSAGGDPSKIQASKKRITNAIVALIAFFFLYGALQWLIPGGLL